MDMSQLDKMQYICDYLRDQMQYTCPDPEENVSYGSLMNDVNGKYSSQLSSDYFKKHPSFDGSLNQSASHEFTSIKNDMITRSASAQCLRRTDMLQRSKAAPDNCLLSTPITTSANEPQSNINIKIEPLKCKQSVKNKPRCHTSLEKYRAGQKLPSLSSETNQLIERSKSLSKLMEDNRPKSNLFRDIIAPKVLTRSFSDIPVSVISKLSENSVTSVKINPEEFTSDTNNSDEISEDALSVKISPNGFCGDLHSSYEEKETKTSLNPTPRIVLSKIVDRTRARNKNGRILTNTNDCLETNYKKQYKSLDLDTNILELNDEPFRKCDVLPDIKSHSDTERMDEDIFAKKLTLYNPDEYLSDSPVILKPRKPQRRGTNNRLKVPSKTKR